MAKVKNDPENYVKREVCAPKRSTSPTNLAHGGSIDKGSRFFTAPILPGFYIDLRPHKVVPKK